MVNTGGLSDLLRWYVEMGADEPIGEHAANRLIVEKQHGPALPAPAPSFSTTTDPQPAISNARKMAATAKTLVELEAAIRGFEGCALRRTATNTVFADGDPHGPLMIIGEAPGADEDRIGLPFVGRAGKLLDRMLAAIGMDRGRTYITNVLFWRPPGNRKPTSDEISACLPFVWRHIALANPRILVFAGGTSASALLNRSDGIMKLRGRWFDLNVPDIKRTIPALATFHPAFLLRSPARKSDTWSDLMRIQSRLQESDIGIPA